MISSETGYPQEKYGEMPTWTFAHVLTKYKERRRSGHMQGQCNRGSYTGNQPRNDGDAISKTAMRYVLERHILGPILLW